MTKDNLERLAFPQLTEEQLSALAKFTTLENYQAGQTLFSAGDSGFKFFVIKKGEVEIDVGRETMQNNYYQSLSGKSNAYS